MFVCAHQSHSTIGCLSNKLWLAIMLYNSPQLALDVWKTTLCVHKLVAILLIVQVNLIHVVMGNWMNLWKILLAVLPSYKKCRAYKTSKHDCMNNNITVTKRELIDILIYYALYRNSISFSNPIIFFSKFSYRKNSEGRVSSTHTICCCYTNDFWENTKMSHINFSYLHIL